MKKRRTNLRAKTRTTHLFVERLEYRRLMSASPNRIELPNSPRLDAFIQDRDQLRGNENRGRASGRLEERVEQVRSDRDRGNQDRKSRGQRGNSKFTDAVASPRKNQTSRTILKDSSTSGSILSFEPFRMQTRQVDLVSVDLRESSNIAERVSPPLRLEMPDASSDSIRVLEPTGRSELRLRQESVAFGPRFVSTASAAEPGPVTAPRIVAARTTTPVSINSNRETASVVSSSIGAADAIAMAAFPFATFGFGEDDEKKDQPLEVVEMANLPEFGGAIDFSQMPMLIDTLPVIVDETTTLFNLGEGEEFDEDQDREQDDSVSESPSKTWSATKDDTQKHDRSRNAKATSARLPSDVSADFVFADAEKSELFGGVIEMPEALTSSANVESEVLFDAIVPDALRIDQIISQAPMMEIENDSQEPTQEDKPEPLSINAQAVVPAAILLVPALALDATKQRQRDVRRYLLPSTSTKKGGQL